VLVRDLGDRFQLVLQPDHGELSGQIAAAWIDDDTLSAELRAALVLAAMRHDDGWAVWERHPRLDAHGRPQTFYDVERHSLLSSYRAAVEVLQGEGPAAALLVSMHVAGLQRNRYGEMTEHTAITPLEDLEPEIQEFVRGEEQRQEKLVAELNIDERERWRAYRLLQVYDLLSLYLGLAAVDRGETTTVALAPGDDGAERLELVPADAPWTICCEPFPFASAPTQLQMPRRLVAKGDCAEEASFRLAFHAAPVETVVICLTPAPDA